MNAAASSSVYHTKLPETASMLFMLFYGLWALFILLLAIGLLAFLVQGWAQLKGTDHFIIALPTAFAVYSAWVLRKITHLLINRFRLPQIKQQIARLPIPPRSLPQSAFVWQSGQVHFHLYQAAQWLKLHLQPPVLGMSLIIAISLLWISGLSDFVIGFALFGLLLFNTDKPVRIRYDADSDVLVVENWQNRQWTKSAQYHLSEFIGVTVQTEDNGWQIQLIDKQKQACQLLDSSVDVAKLLQTVGKHTGLPVLQRSMNGSLKI